jgi:acetyltransferase EpsM
LKLPDNDYYFITIGNNEIRKKIVNSFKVIYRWATLIHPRAIINTKLENILHGVLICAGAVIEPGTHIGQYSIINTNASVNHDCDISCFVHICPGTNLCGDVSVGWGTMIGAGSTVKEKINIAGECIIGSGSNVVKNIERPKTLAYGNPCKEIKDIKLDMAFN